MGKKPLKHPKSPYGTVCSQVPIEMDETWREQSGEGLVPTLGSTTRSGGALIDEAVERFGGGE